MNIKYDNKDLVSFNDFNKLWKKDCSLIFDTSFLLRLYDYSPSITSHFLKLIEDNIEKVWLPHQVLKEFKRNNESVRKNAYGKFKEVPTSLKAIVDQLESRFDKKFENYKRYQFPAIEELENKLNSLTKLMSAEIRTYKKDVELEEKNNRLMIEQDTIKLFIQKLIDRGAIGSKFSSEELLSIYKEGEERYKYKIPPGYMDSEKDEKNDNSIRRFGDLILWKQILRYAKFTQKPIILITLDAKEDWWVLDDSQNLIEPREELLEEFEEYSKADIIITNLPTFEKHLSLINNMINIPIRIELEALQIVEEIFNDSWDEILNGADELSQDIIESGALNSYFKNKEDYNIFYSYSEIPNLENVAAAIKGNTATITAKFQCETVVDLTLYVMSHDDEDIEEAEILLNVEGNVTVQFEFDSSKVDDYINEDSIKTDIDSLYISFINELT